MAKLTTSQRNRMPKSSFALPGKGSGAYPINDKAHARAALSRISQHGSSAEKAEVRRKVHEKFPSIGHKPEHHFAHGKPRT